MEWVRKPVPYWVLKHKIKQVAEDIYSLAQEKITVREIMGVETTTVHKITGVDYCDTLDPLFPAGVKRDGDREKVDF